MQVGHLEDFDSKREICLMVFSSKIASTIHWASRVITERKPCNDAASIDRCDGLYSVMQSSTGCGFC